jgi:hypothetical protein
LEAAASVVVPPRPWRLVALFRWITGRTQRDRTRLEAERRRRIVEALQRHDGPWQGFGLVVTSVPKVPIWEVCNSNVLWSGGGVYRLDIVRDSAFHSDT